MKQNFGVLDANNFFYVNKFTDLRPLCKYLISESKNIHH